MSKELLFAKNARCKMAQGAKILADAVKVTLGPKGKNVVIEQDFGAPLIVNDGVTIAKAISLCDKFENMGAAILIEAASKTNDLVGDGTTTAILLTSKLIEEGLNKVEEGISPVVLRAGLNYYLPYIHQMIDEVSVEVKSVSDLEKIATISSGSHEVGKLISNAYQEVGPSGIITIEESQGLEDYLEVVKGYSFEKGYLSSYMASNEEKTEAVLDNPFVLITDRKINSMQEVVPYLEETIKQSRPLLIICDDITDEVLGAIVLNKLRGVFNCVVVKAPSFGERKQKVLQDIALLTNAKIIDSTIGMDFSEAPLEVLGLCEKATISKDQTVIINSSIPSEVILNYVEGINNELSHTTSEYDQEKLRARIAKLLGGIAQIRIGAETEVVLKEKKLRIEDALNATTAATISGVIEGGGKVLYQIAEKLKNIIAPREYLDACEILEKTLKAPFYQILENAGANQSEVLKQVTDTMWYDALTGKIVNMKDAGIIDPASVEKSAIMSAISIAGIFLTTECAIVDHTKNQEVNEENLL